MFLWRTLCITIALGSAGCASASGPDIPSDQASAAKTVTPDKGSAEAVREPPPPAADSDPGHGQSPKPEAGPPVLAVDSTPPGVAPLSEAEQQESKHKCKPLVEAIAARAQKDRRRQEPIAYVREVLKGPPQMPKEAHERCAELILRDMLAYRARSLEAQAINELKRIVVGLSTAMAGTEARLCPSAPAVPADHRGLASGPYRSTAADWQAEGWQCVRFDLTGRPQRFQYELSTDPKARSYEIIARGYSVEGQPVVELFLPGKVEGGAIQPSSEIYRRR